MTDFLLPLNDIHIFNLKGKRIKRMPFCHPLPNESVNMEKDFRDVTGVQTAVKLSVSMAERNMRARNAVANLYVNIKKLDQSVRYVVGNLFVRMGKKSQGVDHVEGVLIVNMEI
jgi:molybdenum cofactor biosynthesis enzyme